MIFPKRPQSIAAVATHYDELDSFYREIWGEHVHHGYWATGRESAGQAVEALVDRLDLLARAAGAPASLSRAPQGLGEDWEDSTITEPYAALTVPARFGAPALC